MSQLGVLKVTLNLLKIMNFLKLPSRQTQLWILILLSAATMIIPYFLQGSLSSGKSPNSVSDTVWLWDHIAWSIRAIVEGLVISYIAVTKTDNQKDNIILWSLKVALIALIAFTLGPVMYASLNSLKMSEALNEIVQWLWAIGLASYMPLMVLGASYAYKVQPDDNEDQSIVNQLQSDFNALQNDYKALQTIEATLQSKLKALSMEHQAIEEWQQLPASGKAALIYQYSNGDKPTVKELAELLNCSEGTINYGYKKARENQA